jgi:hypothetical protein
MVTGMASGQITGRATDDRTFYLSRGVIAVKDGVTGVFGPVHSERGLKALTDDLSAGGWDVQGHAKITSAAQLKQLLASQRQAAGRGGTGPG